MLQRLAYHVEKLCWYFLLTFGAGLAIYHYVHFQ